MAKQIKIRVIKRFRNKYSKRIHEVGDILRVSPTRFAEIKKLLPGYVKLEE